MSHWWQKMPKRARKFTADEIQMIETLAGDKLPIKEMCCFFKLANGMAMSPDYFQECINKDPAARNALAVGRAKVSYATRSTLREMALGKRDKNGDWLEKPDISALRKWLETQEEGFIQTEKLELTGQNGEPIKQEVLMIDREQLLSKIKDLKNALDED